MKYNTISTSSLASEGKKSSFTIYADMDISQNKITYSEAEMTSIRGELEIVQKALKLQTKRCRQLVAEYTRRLQEKEVQYRSEKALRDDQLAKVLRALLIFEARLRQEQKFITHQLNEKDYIISKQSNDIKKLLSNQYCKSCNQFYRSSPINESLDSSSEYVVTDFQDYQSSNFESLDSSSETYATLSEKSYNKTENLYQSYNHEENSKSETESVKSIYQKNRNKDSLGRRSRKITHRKSIGTYFEVLKLRNDNSSPMSNEDNTSNDYDNLDSLPPESITDKISLVSGSIECIFENNQPIYNGSESSPNISLSECNNTVINKSIEINDSDKNVRSNTPEPNENSRHQPCKITESIPVFEVDDETNDNWYASASDQEDEEHRDIYRNNPVLECMNQILLQNINDSLNSPPKTPNVERKSLKRVKFSDEEENKADNNETTDNCNQNYYETPIQKTPNFYETPQSIYSNDYEQILSKCSESLSDTNQLVDRKVTTESSEQPVNHYYVHMENKSEENVETKIVRKSKILRTPPALPPKPANLTTKYKNQNIVKKSSSEKSDDSITELEPDYCSISELNLPQTKTTSFKKINVVAEINAPTSLDVLSKLHPQLDNDNFIKISSVENRQCKTDNAESKLDVPGKLHSTNDVKVKLHSLLERGSNIEKKSNTNETKSDISEKIQPVVENKAEILDKIISADNKQNATGKNLGKVLSTDAKRDNLANIHLNESKVDKLTKISSSEARHPFNQTKANILGSMISNDSKHDVIGNRHSINETQVTTFTKSPSKDILGKRHFSNDTNTEMLNKMYYTKECNINVLGKLHSNENKLKEKIQINDNLVVKKCVEKLNIQLAKQTPIKSEPIKKIEPEIPKLPQVSEIIIPDETEDKDKEEMISQDNYVKNNSQIFKLQTNRNELSRRPIVIGSSVSSLISGFNQQLLSEIKMKPERNKLGKHLFSSFENLQNTDKQTIMKEEKSETPKFDNFDLSQNFEEFKLDDCDLEEYTVEEDMQSEISDKSTDDNKSRTSDSTSSTRVELIRATNDFLTPTLNRNSIELLKKQLELQKSQLQNEQLTRNNHSARNNEPTYEHFLECTGLSSKSILTPSRLLSNHKSMLKPKDVKLRSKVRANNSMFERHSTSSVKYWSEPYI